MPLRILIADDEAPARHALRKALSQGGYEILEAPDGGAALEAIRTNRPDLVFLDLNMPALDGRGVLQQLGTDRAACEIIVVTANEAIGSAVECMRLGAADYITKPYEVEQLRAIARRCAERRELQDRVESLQAQVDRQNGGGPLVGISRPIRQLYEQMIRAARAPVDVLIRGETGTGKELVAREIHRLSTRAKGPFVAVNTAAIAGSLAESELFGHVRGAFTGAAGDRAGVFEQASGGTLFLDEIGDMPLEAQTKILRALQERVVQPVGSSRLVPVDVRVITATHQDLEHAIEAGEFRRDLFYRIKSVELHVPPLRARREDILVLANCFLERAAERTGEPARTLADDAVACLLAHSWPGNVRELQHVIEAAAAMCETEQIHSRDLSLVSAACDPQTPTFAAYADLPLTEAKARLTAEFERFMIESALERSGGNVSAAARTLGIHRQNLQQKIEQLELKPQRGSCPSQQ